MAQIIRTPRGPSNDQLLGNVGDDLLFGEDDDDLLRGGSGDDQLFGRDLLLSDDGDDPLAGCGARSRRQRAVGGGREIAIMEPRRAVSGRSQPRLAIAVLSAGLGVWLVCFAHSGRAGHDLVEVALLLAGAVSTGELLRAWLDRLPLR